MIALDHLWILLLALIIDAVVGDPPWLWKPIPHPVAIIGGFIDVNDRVLNRRGWPPLVLNVLGAILLIAVTGLAAMIGYVIEAALRLLPFGWIGIAIVASVLLASRSLFDHVSAVAQALDRGIEEARYAVSHIVGRDPGSLDKARISRAAIESAGENFSDGVVAPVFWFLLLGLPGLFAYKAINTADSMIGHTSDKHRSFGWAAARVDDLVNLIPARLAGGFVALAAPLGGGSIGASFAGMFADAGSHRSPNAGWPEAAMAHGLDIAMAGPRRYGEVLVNDPFLNASGRRDPDAGDIRRALRIYIGANAIMAALVLAVSAPVYL